MAADLPPRSEPAKSQFLRPPTMEDRSPRPGRVWNHIPDDMRDRVVCQALDEPELSTVALRA